MRFKHRKFALSVTHKRSALRRHEQQQQQGVEAATCQQA
jgi:hypothetical protein